MKFECIKTVEKPWCILNEPAWHKKSSPHRYPFIKGEIYESWVGLVARTNLYLIDETGENHVVGIHCLHWKFDRFYKEHFVKVKN